MAKKDPATSNVKRPATRSGGRKASGGFSDAEKAAMKERAEELKTERRRGKKKAGGEQDLLAKVAELPLPDRDMAERLHALVMKAAPGLEPRTYYGMPAWAKDGKVLCFLQPASKFGTRYATFGFNDGANLDDGSMWATSFALLELGPEQEKQLASLVERAAS